MSTLGGAIGSVLNNRLGPLAGSLPGNQASVVGPGPSNDVAKWMSENGYIWNYLTSAPEKAPQFKDASGKPIEQQNQPQVNPYTPVRPLNPAEMAMYYPGGNWNQYSGPKDTTPSPGTIQYQPMDTTGFDPYKGFDYKGNPYTTPPVTKPVQDAFGTGNINDILSNVMGSGLLWGGGPGMDMSTLLAIIGGLNKDPSQPDELSRQMLGINGQPTMVSHPLL